MKKTKTVPFTPTARVGIRASYTFWKVKNYCLSQSTNVDSGKLLTKTEITISHLTDIFYTSRIETNLPFELCIVMMIGLPYIWLFQSFSRKTFKKSCKSWLVYKIWILHFIFYLSVACLIKNWPKGKREMFRVHWGLQMETFAWCENILVCLCCHRHLSHIKWLMIVCIFMFFLPSNRSVLGKIKVGCREKGMPFESY